jgi:hypothetical protein
VGPCDPTLAPVLVTVYILGRVNGQAGDLGFEGLGRVLTKAEGLSPAPYCCVPIDICARAGLCCRCKDLYTQVTAAEQNLSLWLCVVGAWPIKGPHYLRGRRLLNQSAMLGVNDTQQLQSRHYHCCCGGVANQTSSLPQGSKTVESHLSQSAMLGVAICVYAECMLALGHGSLL